MQILNYKELKPFIEGEFRNGGFWIRYKTKSEILKDIQNVYDIFDSIKDERPFKGAENMGNRISYIQEVLKKEWSEDPIKNSALFAFSIVEGIRISYREPFSKQLEGILNVLLEKLNRTDHSHDISMMGFRIAGLAFCIEFEERKDKLNLEQKEKWINAGRFLSSFYSEIGLRFVAATVSYTIEKEEFKKDLIEQYIEVVKEFQFIKEIILDQFQIPYLGFSGRVKTLSSIILNLRNDRETRIIFPDDLVGFRFILEDSSNYSVELIPDDPYIASSSTIIFHSGKKYGEEQIGIGDLLILPSSTNITVKQNQRNYNAIHWKFQLNRNGIFIPTEIQITSLESYLSATSHSQYKANNIPELEHLPKATEVARKFFEKLLDREIKIDLPIFLL
jgi:hypothetical protein